MALRQAPHFNLEGGTAWINTAPLRMEDLRGKIVLLDFWTYCCINCHHILPALAKLEQKYPNDLVVIGVHTPKFFAERDTENLRRKVREYQIKHPVINDAEQKIWDRFGVNSWPTLIVLGPHGEPLAKQSGEVPFEALDEFVGKQVRRFKAKNEINETPVKFEAEIDKPDSSPLLFPGKVLADATGKRLFIADTGHSRIVVADLDGKVQQVYGDGTAALKDGPADKAQFNRPQGMCLVENTLYVADTENHAIRAIDLKAKDVKTVAGTGHQTYKYDSHGAGTKTALTSPWDVVLIPGTKHLLIAMAGHHQIWRYDIESGVVGVWAGTGREDIIDGPLHEAAFAQPSGLATDGTSLFVADSEGSAVRVIGLKSGRVLTLAGTHDLPNGQSLFAFGDTDGVADEARLQHCLGVAFGDGKVYVADTYNNKIKVISLRTQDVKTLAGDKKAGESDDPPHFYQPGGLSLAGSTLYVADTNNFLIRAIDLKTDAVRTLALSGLNPPVQPKAVPSFAHALLTPAPKVKVVPGKSVTLNVKLPLAEKTKINADAPSMPYVIDANGTNGLVASDLATTVHKVEPPTDKFSVTVPLTKEPTAGDSLEVKLSVQAFVCDTGSNLCQIKNYVWTVPITFADDGDKSVTLTAKTH
ncbi:MAG: thioredoxin-like domain-containing protein [Isosphaeraceae bacterium]|nr:thioredoxin-like domain-containing protein [Isosphaeraceae bacterium]